MVATWRDDLVQRRDARVLLRPAPDVDAILPLQITPPPSSVVRAFVGRMEVITPESEADVARALADEPTPA